MRIYFFGVLLLLSVTSLAESKFNDRVYFWKIIWSMIPDNYSAIYDENTMQILNVVPSGKASKEIKRLDDLLVSKNYSNYEFRLLMSYLDKSVNSIKLKSQSGRNTSLNHMFKNRKWRYNYVLYVTNIMKLPNFLAAVPIVESLYKYNAISHVGAFGDWQIMENTARGSLIINNLIDERMLLERSTNFSLNLLKKYRYKLGRWDLAVTAYIYGISSLLDDLKTYNVSSLDELNFVSRSKSYGFSSRNYYPQIVAVNEIVTGDDFFNSR